MPKFDLQTSEAPQVCGLRRGSWVRSPAPWAACCLGGARREGGVAGLLAAPPPAPPRPRPRPGFSLARPVAVVAAAEAGPPTAAPRAVSVVVVLLPLWGSQDLLAGGCREGEGVEVTQTHHSPDACATCWWKQVTCTFTCWHLALS